jgi:plastocyanin
VSLCLFEERSGVRGRQRQDLLLRALVLVLVSLLGPVRLPAQDRVSVPPANSATHTVEIKGLKFLPEVVNVHPGDKVVWTNNDIVPHTATTVDKGFDSGSIGVGASWVLSVPAKKGEYLYTCTFHPNMKAKLLVQ